MRCCTGFIWARLELRSEAIKAFNRRVRKGNAKSAEKGEDLEIGSEAPTPNGEQLAATICTHSSAILKFLPFQIPKTVIRLWKSVEPYFGLC